MAQVVNPAGLLLGHGTYIFTGEGDPNSSTAELLTSQNDNGDSVSLGSKFIDRLTGAHYVKTGAISASAPSGTWSTVTVS